MLALVLNFKFSFLFKALFTSLMTYAASCPSPNVYGKVQIRNDDLVLVLNEASQKEQVYKLQLDSFSEIANFFALENQYINAVIGTVFLDSQAVKIESYQNIRPDFLNPSGPLQISLIELGICQNQKRGLASEKKKGRNK